MVGIRLSCKIGHVLKITIPMKRGSMMATRRVKFRTHRTRNRCVFLVTWQAHVMSLEMPSAFQFSCIEKRRTAIISRQMPFLNVQVKFLRNGNVAFDSVTT